ncbi:MAG: 30S ribosomal protein S20 [Candidatus Pacebacteria bacterium]|nr:30S ribosomal protein S20 [Candidatus Paceibacterota bacterium]
MPNTRSAKKRLVQDVGRKKRNMHRKLAVKDAKKSFLKALDTGNVAEAQEALTKCFAALDRAANHNTISKNKMSRDKKRLSVKLHAAQQAG